MELIREYLLSVTAAVLLCSVIRSFAGEKGVVPFVCGIFLILTVIRPLTRISIYDRQWNPGDIMKQADIAVAEGEDYAQAAMARHIKSQCEAYILNKAKDFGCDILATFTLHDDLMPAGCVIQGTLSPYEKEQLSEFLERDMGIPREDQQWIP